MSDSTFDVVAQFGQLEAAEADEKQQDCNNKLLVESIADVLWGKDSEPDWGADQLDMIVQLIALHRSDLLPEED